MPLTAGRPFRQRAIGWRPLAGHHLPRARISQFSPSTDVGDRPPFDPARACFWLIAGVLIVHCIVALVGLGWCVWQSDAIIAGKLSCDKVGDHLNALLAAALAAALAFAGVRRP